jgi:uncharacterized protein Yka (UPF0111/DUF47 family)
MASHDTEIRRLRAASQESTVQVQKLNEELRKLKESIDREQATKRKPGNSRKPKS